MRVRATDVGYYDHVYRKKGDVFLLHDEKAFSERWMERLDKSGKAKAKAKAEPVQQEESLDNEGASSGDEDVI